MSRVLKPIAVIAVIILAAVAVWYFVSARTMTINAQFESTKGVYAGDTVRVLGVEVGRIANISPEDGHSTVTMKVDADVAIPEDANALLVAQSLVAERFIQLTPVHSDGPQMEDGGTIPADRTAVPVEWDGIKEQLLTLSSALGPTAEDPDGALSGFVDSADAVLDGNGTAIRTTLNELSHTMSVLSGGREDLFTTLRNLQLFVSALSSSEEQIVSFGGKLASVSQVLADQTNEIDSALKDLDLAVTDINRFLDKNGDRVTNGVDKLGQATQVLRDRRKDIEGLLHVAPTATSNFYNIYRPYQGTLNGALALNQMSNPTNFLCGAIAGVANNTAESDAELCAQYMAPLLDSFTSNYPYGTVSPPLTPTAEPHQIKPAQKPGTATPDGVQPPAQQPDPLTNVVKGDDLTSTLMFAGGPR